MHSHPLMSPMMKPCLQVLLLESQKPSFCPNKRCRDKALDDDRTCQKCNTTYQATCTGRGAVAKVAIDVDEDIETFTKFKPTLMCIVTLPENGQLKQAILDILPLKVSVWYSNDNIITHMQNAVGE